MDGPFSPLSIPGEGLDCVIPGELWTPSGGGDRRLLIVHDGGDFKDKTELIELCERLISERVVLPFNVALLKPVDRHRWYSPDWAYCKAVVTAGLDIIGELVGTPEQIVGLGASLGALPALGCALLSPAESRGLMLMSGSFWRGDQMSKFEYRDAVLSFVAEVEAAGTTGHPLEIRMTCDEGTNLGNSKLMKNALARQGHSVHLEAIYGPHEYWNWKLHLPQELTTLLQTCWLN